jgi:guanyl-specific ribonuclease Sa
MPVMNILLRLLHSVKEFFQRKTSSQTQKSFISTPSSNMSSAAIESMPATEPTFNVHASEATTETNDLKEVPLESFPSTVPAFTIQVRQYERLIYAR